MRFSLSRSKFPGILAPAKKMMLGAAVLLGVGMNQQLLAQTHELQESGVTRVEAEDYSASSGAFPAAEPCTQCSGERTVGNFWGNSWFEIEVDVPALVDYRLSLRASSPTGTQLDIQLVNDLGETSLATVDIPQTDSWWDYKDVPSVMLQLTPGVHTLRFKNLIDGANVDYMRFTAGFENEVVTNVPRRNSGPDINPLKGFTSGWWREGEDHASVGFQYIQWDRFEPTDDNFDWDYVEEVINRAGSQGRHVILQFVCDWDGYATFEENYLGPDWLLDLVGEERDTLVDDFGNERPIRATRYNEAEFIAEASEAVTALLDRYKDDPRTFVLQVGVLGFWAEWHTFPREEWAPTPETKQAILDVYKDVLDLEGDHLTQVRYPDEPVNVPTKGIGYTNGSIVLTEHGSEFGEEIGKRQLWKNGPVGGEWPPNVHDMQLWKRFFWTREGHAFLYEGRYSTMLPPEDKEIASNLRGWKKDRFYMGMHRFMGYNFQAKSVRHLVENDGAGPTSIEVDLHNSGIAPFYKNWDVQLALIDGDTGSVVQVLDAGLDIRQLEPRKTLSIKVASDLQLDSIINYQIGLRIVQPGATEDKVKPWGLLARNVYVELANDLPVIEGSWDENNALQGGWNILDEIDF